MGFGKDGKGVILHDRVDGIIGALATKDLVDMGGAYNDTLLEDFRIIKMDYFFGVKPPQAVVLNDGPILVGIAGGHITAAGIEASIEALALNRNALTLEFTHRPVWPLEIIMIPDADNGSVDRLTYKGSVNLRWTFQNPDGWTWWAYNLSNQNLIDGSVIHIFAKIFGVWLS